MPRLSTGAIALSLVGAVVLAMAGTGVLVADTLEVRYRRDVTRMVFNDNVELLRELRRQAGLETDSLGRLIAMRTEASGPIAGRPYIVVSIEEHRLWYRAGDSVLFSAPVATGSGKILERSGGDLHWRFETPRGRLSVQSKETDPVWIPPDWHYVEEAQRLGLGVVRLNRGQSISDQNGATITTIGSNVVRKLRNGKIEPFSPSDGSLLIVRGNVVIPPFGTNQRKLHGVLGSHRLNLGGGYALHGTNKPETVGQSVSHGCVRLRNEDIATLYEIVPVGTPVFIY
jgi:hypothetical protein